MNETLILPMMMFGKFRSKVTKKDEDGKAIKKNGKYVYQKSWVYHKEEEGDKGVYPSVNHIYTRMQNGRQKLTKPAEDLKEKWEALSKMWARDNDWELTQEEKVVVELTAHFPHDKIRRDTNNVFKLMMDAFEDIIYDDDFYAIPRVIDFKRVPEGEAPFFEVNIYKKEDEAHVLYERLKSAGIELRSSGVDIPNGQSFATAIGEVPELSK